MTNQLFKRRNTIDLIQGKNGANLKRKIKLVVENNGTSQI